MLLIEPTLTDRQLPDGTCMHTLPYGMKKSKGKPFFPSNNMCRSLCTSPMYNIIKHIIMRNPPDILLIMMMVMMILMTKIMIIMMMEG